MRVHIPIWTYVKAMNILKVSKELSGKYLRE